MLMVWNQSKFRIPLKLPNKKVRFWHNFFHFQVLETFGNLEIDFSITLNKCYEVIIITMLNYFLLQFWQTIKQIWSMPLQYCYIRHITWKNIYSCTKFYCPRVREAWAIRTFSCDKNIFFLNVSLSHKY